MTRHTIFIIILLVGCKSSKQKAIAPQKTYVVIDSSSLQDLEHINSTTIAPRNIDIFNFLESLKWKENTDSGGYDLNKTPKWDTSLLTNNISDNGILFVDPNDSFNKPVSKKQIRQELSAMKGKSYEMISHFTYIYSIPYKQYSEIKFKENQKKETIVDIGNWYELTFESKQNRHYLIKCEYLQIEDE